MKCTKRILAVLLAIAMTICLLPAEAMATDTLKEEKESVEAAALEEEVVESGEAEVIGEDESRRDQNTKHFVLSDGSRRAVMYSEPVHYEEDGQWKDIDNTLEYNETMMHCGTSQV